MPVSPPFSLPSTRETALALARQFAPLMGLDYARNRNFVTPGHPNVSRLAAAVRVRLISENELAQMALETHGGLAPCQKFVQEIHWRSYWRSWLELRPDVWTNYERSRDAQRQNIDSATRKRLQDTENGASGVAVMDEFARELVETGYLHNHARMWFAAFWIHTQKLPWPLGADFFERHLACACPASNTLSWRWVAGLQTFGKTYLARRSNLEKYADPAYLEVATGLEQLEKPSAVAPMAENVPAAQTPHFELELPSGAAPTGVWISEDDFAPETSLLVSCAAQTVAVSQITTPQSGFSNGLRDRFRREAASDAETRAAIWNAPLARCEAENPAQLAAQLETWARENNLKRVVALKPFVGPSGDALPDLQKNLEAAGIALHLLRRAEDAALLPHASAGYFRFWKAIEDANRAKAS